MLSYLLLLTAATFSADPFIATVEVAREHRDALNTCGRSFRFRLFKDVSSQDGQDHPIPVALRRNEIPLTSEFEAGRIEIRAIMDLPPEARPYVFSSMPARISDKRVEIMFRPLENVAQGLQNQMRRAIDTHDLKQLELLTSQLMYYSDRDNPQSKSVFTAAESIIDELSKHEGRNRKLEKHYQALLSIMLSSTTRFDHRFRYANAYRSYIMTAYFGDGTRLPSDDEKDALDRCCFILENFLRAEWQSNMATEELRSFVVTDAELNAFEAGLDQLASTVVPRTWPAYNVFSIALENVSKIALKRDVNAEVRLATIPAPPLNTLEVQAAAPDSITYKGTFSGNRPLEFGGPPYCNYSFTWLTAEMALDVDSSDNVTHATIRINTKEDTLGDCPHPPLPVTTRTFKMDSVSVDDAGNLDIKFQPDGDDRPFDLSFAGFFSDSSRISGVLLLQRKHSDLPPELRDPILQFEDTATIRLFAQPSNASP